MSSRSVQLYDQPCPTCRKNSLTLTESTENVDYFGPVVISTITCSSCGYKDADVYSVSVGEPSLIRARIASTKDLTMKVVRSSSASIRAPKLGVSINPGPAAEGFITNVEGILDRMQQILEWILPSLSSKQKERAQKVLANLKKARQGKLSFVLELRDPSGHSGIAGSDMTKIKRKLLPDKELESLGKTPADPQQPPTSRQP